MPNIPLREAALAAVAARLLAHLPDVVTERARRASVDVDADSLPRLVVTGGDMTADDSMEPGRTHYAVQVLVAGVVNAASDLAAEQALSVLHARVVDALAGWTPAEPGLGDLAEQGAEFRLYDAEESAQPAGEFLARFSLLAVSPAGGAWSA